MEKVIDVEVKDFNSPKLDSDAPPLNFKWLKDHGFIEHNDLLLHPKMPNIGLHLEGEVSEDLGQLVYFYMMGENSRKQLIYTAYYLDSKDFLSENKVV